MIFFQAIMALCRIKSKPFPRYGEVLAREPSGDNINILWKMEFTRLTFLDQIDNGFHMINPINISSAGKEMIPSFFCTGQYIVSKNGLKPVFLQTDKILVDVFINPIRMNIFIDGFF